MERNKNYKKWRKNLNNIKVILKYNGNKTKENKNNIRKYKSFNF